MAIAMTKQREIGRYLAQGIGANALVIYLFLLGAVLWSGGGGYAVLVVIVAPIYCLIAGVFGLVTATAIWLFELAIHRKLNFWLRGLGGILSSATITILMGVGYGFLHDGLGLLGVMGAWLLLILPAALASGLPLNPLAFLVTDLTRGLPATGLRRAFPTLATLLLRLGSVIGLTESLLFLACLGLPGSTAWVTTQGDYVDAIIAVVYFAITLIVSLCLPPRIIVMAIGILANAPVAAFAVASQQQDGFEHQFLAVLGWVVIAPWIPFLVGQFMRAETRRIVPVTMLEIRIRHAFNYW